MTETPSNVPPTVLSALQATAFPDNTATSSLHPFSASNEQTVAFLHTLLETSERVAHSVTLHSATVVDDSRTVSLLRQQSARQHELNLSRTQVERTMVAAQERRRAGMGYEGPSDGSSTLARISACSSAAGMQAFPGAAADTLVLGGQVLVLDVALIPEPTVHASYAGSAEDRHSPAMDAFFSRLVSGVSKGGDGRRLRDALEYLMRLDQLAMREGNAGARWLGEVDALAKELLKFTQEEAALLAQVRGQPSVPLDVLLLRGHALGLPYLHSPTLCFLVYLSPRAYLSLQRSAPATVTLQLPSFDIPSAHLYDHLSVDIPPPGVTRATLTLVPLPQTPSTLADPMLSSRSSFPLAPAALEFTHDFPLPTGPDAGKYGWVLTFGQGIVMSQSRMLEIARVVQHHDQFSYTGTGPSLSYVTGGWVDMLLNPESALIAERYTATYVSPTNMHPPLRLTLTTPDEPGFLLERVQVCNMQEVWAVLEIVRDQCWLNETLNGISWIPEAIAGPPIMENSDTEATEEELRALLSGTYIPRSIPVNVYVLAPSSIGFTFPERPPMPGMVIISVALNGAAGATVEVQGAMGADVQMLTLEEAVRRGGALGLPGRVWAASQVAP
ncbi:hypothetical protein BJV74DRAFT_612947 [Russula compacta]|nr:hypothetical protein BJV74DRAFT_612947 [Russula compacta]